MFCMGCGAALRDNAKFCHMCGTPVGSSQMPPVVQQPAYQQPVAAVQQPAYQQPAVQQPMAPAQQPAAQQPVAAGAHPVPEPPVLNTRTTIFTNNGKRSQILFPCRSTTAAAVTAAESVLMSNGFSEREYRGETVWKKGTGLATAMQYAVVMPYNEGLLVQGWVQVGVGSAGLSEMNLEGVAAAIPKKSLLKVIEKIRQAI